MAEGLPTEDLVRDIARSGAGAARTSYKAMRPAPSTTAAGAPISLIIERALAMTVRSSACEQLPLRWAIILLVAVVAALLTGALTFAQTASWPAALLAALAAAGGAIPAAHRILATR